MDANNIVNLHPENDIHEQARAWVLKFNHDRKPTEAEVQALNEWVKRSPLHLSALKEAEQLWIDADLLSELAVPLTRTTSRKQGYRSRLHNLFNFRRTAWSFATLAVFTIAISLLFQFQTASTTNGTYSTITGELHTLTLRDQSQVVLDTASKIEVKYDKQIRLIELIEGKAHFQVAKDPTHPFYVKTRNGVVRAVGTAFSVTVAKNKVKVTVDEGEVELARASSTPPGVSMPEDILKSDGNKNSRAKSALPTSTSPYSELGEVALVSLTAGETAVVDDHDVTVSKLNALSMKKELSWREGILFFNGDPLSEVILEISRYTDLQIDISDPRLNQLEIGGRFKAGQVDALFDVLQAGFGIEVNFTDNKHAQLSYPDSSGKAFSENTDP